MSDKILNEGFHLKAPWPVGKVELYETGRVRTIHVGSHHSKDGTVFKEGVPLLWTNMHGIADEELLLTASPKELMRNAFESGGKIGSHDQQVPSISLAGADVTVDYVIKDLRSFVVCGANPDDLIRVLSEQCVSRQLLHFEIEELFSGKRTLIAQSMRDSIQRRCDNLRIGAGILHTGITAVHPPRNVAAAYEEKIAAFQEYATKIQQAEQMALKNKVETSGTVDNF
jgi:regulator of protease activity HflC (stomatin/prohibitin superfamily)